MAIEGLPEGVATVATVANPPKHQEKGVFLTMAGTVAPESSTGGGRKRRGNAGPLMDANLQKEIKSKIMIKRRQQPQPTRIGPDRLKPGLHTCARGREDSIATKFANSVVVIY
jgi:hypothetical protein